jgi:hypothetical protein
MLLLDEGFPGKKQDYLFIGYGILITFIIGFRQEVGGDWFSYLNDYEYYKHSSDLLPLIFDKGSHEIGYVLVNWISAKAKLDIIGVNLICAACFMGGLLQFCRKQPLPWLALIVATPFLIIVVGMGYTRQSAALGFVLLAFTQWQSRQVYCYVLLIFIATLFHKTAIFFLPFAIFLADKRKRFYIVLICILILILWSIFFKDSSISMLEHYLNVSIDFTGKNISVHIQEPGLSVYKSSGAGIRALMNSICAMVMVVFRRVFSKFSDRQLWELLAVVSFASLPLAFLSLTAVDRMLIYITPLQLIVWSRLPTLINNRMFRTGVLFSIVLTYALVLWVWFTFASNAKYWIPYKSAFF